MTVAEFGAKLEGYFNGPYTPVQKAEVKRWAQKHSRRVLELVYHYCATSGETHWNPPGIKRLNAAVHEVYEAYPELRAGSYNRQIAEERKMLTDDAGWTDEAMDAALERLRGIVSGAAQGCRMGGENERSGRTL